MLGESIMKLTKARLKQIIREEMDLLALKEFNGAIDEDDDNPGAETEVEPKLAGDVGRAVGKLEKTSGLSGAMASINTKDEFEEMLTQFIQLVAKEKLRPQDVKMGVRNVATKILKAK
jgi:hypothetical protein